MLHIARFLRSYLGYAPDAVREEEVRFPLGDETVVATLLRPADLRPRPGWVVLHGMTVPGRHHASLVRFARALSASGGTVLIPEIRSWRELRIDPAAAEAVIGAAADHLSSRDDVLPGGVAVVGFSFGATQALITAADPALGSTIRSVVGFGGYCELDRTLRFMMTGEHEWRADRYQVAPDPYGRWIVAANYLTRIPGYSSMDQVAEAVRTLALTAGQRGAFAGDPVYDADKAELRRRLAPRERRVFDVLAPPTTALHTDGEAAAELADQLVEAALHQHPALDPLPVLPTLRRRVVLAHGYHDQLIPFSETLRLRARLEQARVHTTITRLFAHSRGAEQLGTRQYPLEVLRYLRLLRLALR